MLCEKLGIKPGFSCLIVNSPKDYIEKLGELPTGTEISQTGSGPGNTFDFVHLFAANRSEIHSLVPYVLKSVKEEGILWVSYPKKGGGLATDLSRDICWSEMKIYGLEPVSQISIDETWSALRFKLSEAINRKPAPHLPEIDYQKRLVFLPDDFQKALKEEGLLEKFKSLSFIHQKEHVLAVVTSKKSETRARRIRKCLAIIKEK